MKKKTEHSYEVSCDMYIVTCVDISDSSDFKPRVLGCFNTRRQAKKYVENDINNMREDVNITDVDKTRMYCYNEDHTYGCEWNIEKIDIMNHGR